MHIFPLLNLKARMKNLLSKRFLDNYVGIHSSRFMHPISQVIHNYPKSWLKFCDPLPRQIGLKTLKKKQLINTELRNVIFR